MALIKTKQNTLLVHLSTTLGHLSNIKDIPGFVSTGALPHAHPHLARGGSSGHPDEEGSLRSKPIGHSVMRFGRRLFSFVRGHYQRREGQNAARTVMCGAVVEQAAQRICLAVPLSTRRGGTAAAAAAAASPHSRPSQ